MRHEYVARESAWVGDGAERGVDVSSVECGDGRVRVVDPQRDHVEFDVRVGAPVVVQDNCLRSAQPQYVDPKSPRGRADRSNGSIDVGDDAERVREKRLAVECQRHPAGRAVEQPDLEPTFERGNALGNGLLRHAEFGGRMLQLPELGCVYERANGLGVHALQNTELHNCWLWLAPTQLIDLVVVVLVRFDPWTSLGVVKQGAVCP